MSIFHIMGLVLCASPIVSHSPRLFFPYSFLGFTLFFLVLLLEDASLLTRAASWALWLSGIFALIFKNPLWYQASLCLFLALQALNYGFRLSSWHAQTATLLGFFAFITGIFTPLALYAGICSLLVLLLISRPLQKQNLKEPPLEP